MRTTRKIWQATLSILLILVMLVQIVPAQVWASVISTEETTSDPVTTVIEDVPVTVVGEEESLRTETEKHFRLSDGSFIAVSYGMPVHYQNASGNWEDIDNTLSLYADQSVYAAFNNEFATAFAANLSAGRVLASSYNGLSVSMSLLDESQARTMVADSVVTLQPGMTITYDRTVVATIVSSEDEQTDSLLGVNNSDPSSSRGWTAEDLIPETLSSSVLYEDVYPGVDLLYTAYGYDIKEQIIVNTKQSAYRYDFFLETVGLTAVLNADSSITMADSEGNVIYAIPAPYMTDSTGETSDAVSYTLTQVSGGYVLTVTADANWINSDDREFPVFIDPTLQEKTTSSKDEVYCTYVREGAPDTAQSRYQQLYFGYSSSASKEGRVFMYFSGLPELPADSIVTDAFLGMYLFDYSDVVCEDLPAAIYEVTNDVPVDDPTNDDYRNWINDMTWRTQPAYNSENAIDYVNIKPGMDNSYLYWNLTEVVKKWYADPSIKNRTLTMAIADSLYPWSSSYAAIACLLAYGSTHPAIITVAYRNNTGIEPYYTYATLGGGQAGTAYIADASGQLRVAKNLVSYASTVNPFSLDLVYNSDYFSYSPDADYQPPAEMGLNMRLGAGWTLSAIQRVEAPVGLADYLKYTDGDGTPHYFYNKPDDSDPLYYDEDGLGLKIEIVNGKYIMSDDNGNSRTFTNTYLTNITDANGNQYIINYTNDRIATIQQQNNDCVAITVATFDYSGDYVSTITDAAGVVYTLGYTDGKLVSISQGSIQLAAYEYSGNRIISMTDSQSNYSIAYAYDGTPGKVSHYHEVGSNGTTGAQVNITYDGYDRTTYRDYGSDRIVGNSDDIVTHYLFDNAGRTINAYSTDSDYNVVGATNAEYTTANPGNKNKDNNRVSKTASIGMAAEQELRNSGFETDDSWTYSPFGEITDDNPRTGNNSMKITLASMSATASVINRTAILQRNQTYTLSGYVNTTSLTFSGQYGVWLGVSFSGNTWESTYMRYNTSESVDRGWTRLSVTFTAPASGLYTVGVVAQGVRGTLYVDDLQLEQGEAPSNRNMLENGNFEIPGYNAWTFGSNGSYQSVPTRGNETDTTETTETTIAATIASTAFNTLANISQTINVNLPVAQTYVLSGWAIGNAVPDYTVTDNQGIEKAFGLRAIVTYDDNSTETFYVSFNADVDEWQFASLTIVPNREKTTVVSITVVCAYEQNLNSVSFDNISLVQQSAQAMKYTAEGKLEQVSTSGIGANNSTYYDNGNLKTTTSSAGITTTYFYEDSSHLRRVTSYSTAVATTSFTYDNFGNVQTTTLKDSDSSLHLLSETVYTEDGNLVTSSTNVNGLTSSYVYGTDRSIMLGLPSRVTSSNGTVTNILYDNFGRTTQTAVVNGATVVYNYSNGNIQTIVRSTGTATQTYRFAYDTFGNLTEIRVGNAVLATYVYAPNNGQLMTQTLGNQGTTTFTYDYLGRIKTETLPDGRTVKYTYNGEGQLYSVTEIGGDSPAVYYYAYDSNGRLVSSEKRSAAGQSLMRVHLYYNVAGQIAGQIWIVGETEYIEGYTYDPFDGTLSTMTVAGLTLAVDYDDLGRLSSVDAGLYSKEYAYRGINGTQTTAQVRKLSYVFPSARMDFEYGYYLTGNIYSYKGPDNNQINYYYDTQGQLTRASVGSTYNYTYSYDTVGNILTANGHTYTYGNAQWRDLLTAYDGETITYDASGNPLSYYNGTRWTLTWENGRSLATVTDGTTSISYAYDASGLRTGKTVDGVTHTYYYASGKLLRETYGSNILDFFYDQNGQPFAFKHNGVLYYYITNLQGDVIYILDGSGATVATYEYDPYGNIVSATGTMAEINPLRYRGYYYDTDTGFYYLQGRYYDPKICRFINADEYASTGQGVLGNNMFTYCLNNPVAYSDAVGSAAKTCLNADGTIDDTPWQADSPGGHPVYRNGGWGIASKNRKKIDITDMLNKAMLEHATELYNYANENGYLAAALYFAENVRGGGEWDLKSQPEWGLFVGVTYIYNGEEFIYDDIGNIHYGYVGRVLFSEETLLCAGGLIQIVSGTSHWSFYNSNFDDPRDQKSISFGYHLWE